MTREEEIRKAQAAIYGTENCRAAEHFAQGASWADAHPHWISVDDELPKDSGDVLVLTKGGKMLVTLGTYEEGEWVWCFYSPKDYITHWIPLPQPPKP